MDIVMGTLCILASLACLVFAATYESRGGRS